MKTNPSRKHFARLTSISWTACTLVVSFLLCSVQAYSQIAEFTQNKAEGHTMNLRVPLTTYPGRQVGVPVNLTYSSRGLWRIGFINSLSLGGGVRRSVTEAIYAEHSTAGWTTSLDIPKVEWPRQNDVYWYTGKPYTQGTLPPWTYRVAQLFMHMPDGSTHEMRKTDAVYADNGTIDMTGTFYSVDSSRMRYDSTGQNTGTLYLPDGSRYLMGSTTVQYIDRNGNTLTFDTTNRQWTDTMGRVIGMPWPVNPGPGDYTYSVPGFNNSSTVYTLKFRSLSSVLSPGSPGLKVVADYFLPFPNDPPSAANFPAQNSSGNLFLSGYSDPEETSSSFTYVVGRGQQQAAFFNPTVLAEIVLPHGQSYTFTYNSYGELDQVNYPTGAYQRYQYGTVGSIGQSDFPYTQGNRGVLSRFISANGTGNDEAQWTYSTGNYPMIVTAPDGTRFESYLFLPTSNPSNNFGYKDSRIGMLAEERVYAPAAQGGAMLRRTLYEYGQTSNPIAKPQPPNTSNPGTYTAWRNPRPNKVVSLVLDTGGDALASATTAQYDGTFQFTVGLESIQTAEYPFFLVNQTTAQTGDITSITLPGPLRTYEKQYLTSNSNYRNRNILGVNTSTVIKNGSGTIVGQVTFAYDEAAYPLIQPGTVIQWTDPLTTFRGNLTTTSRWLDHPTPTWIESHNQYDKFGNLRNVWDPLGRQSQLDYSSDYFFAFGTATTSAVPDPDGDFGRPTSLVRSAVFDLNTGLMTSSTDANGRTTSYEYNDPLNRITKVTRPDGGWTRTSYSDSPSNHYVRSESLQVTTPAQVVIDTYTFVDKAGRVSRTFAKEGATYLTADTQYDIMGRVWRVSSPYRTTALTDAVNPSNQWTSTVYDPLGRNTSVTAPDNAQTTTSYGANLTAPNLGLTGTATDPNGRKRKSVTDAYGRLIQVIEDPSGVGFVTTYTYDVRDNLRKVEQGTQLRYFGYDSFSRLIRSRTVEQTINPALAWTDPVTGYSGWTSASSYDAAGNITARIDARNITTNLTYDALNRVTKVRYVNDPQNTAGVDNYYDGYRDGDDQNIPNSVGRLWQMETIGQVRTSIDTFDTTGRVTSQRQQFWTGATWGTPYQMQQAYNFAGSVTTKTYPSGQTTTYDYDESGRLKTFAGTLGGTSKTYADLFEYNQWAGLQQERFGTDTPLYHKQRFNIRGQLWDIRLSTVSYTADAANGDRGAIVNYYSSSFTQGGSGTDNNGQLLRQETYIPGSNFYQQTYDYDTLNRLKSVTEKLNGTGTDSFKQAYNYDQYGNRTVDQGLTTANVPRPNYTASTATNRLTAPAGFTYSYDAAGNQTGDDYTGGGQRVFDAENRMISAQGGGQTSNFRYSGMGRRVRRIIAGVESRLIYGIDGELVAEYAANAATNSPLKEYGYRNGQLLVTVVPPSLTAPAPSSLTAAPSSGGASISLNWSPGSGATNYRIERKGAGGQYTLAGTTNQTSLVDNGVSVGNAYLYRVCSANGGGNCTSVFSNIALGTAVSFTDPNIISMVDDPSGATVTKMKIEHVTELRSAVNAVRSLASLPNATWTNPTLTRFVSVIMADDVRDLRIKLDEALIALGVTTSSYTDSPLLGAPNGTLIKKIHITELRLRATSGAGGAGGATSQATISWLVSDNLGTPRMVADVSGTLASVKRNDYLPFGEDLGSIGGRNSGQGYGTDTTRQKFTGYETEVEISLNFAQARFQSQVQGRFISVDPMMGSAEIVNPQTFNRYSYTLNNPTNFSDPTGLMPMMPDASMNWSQAMAYFSGNSFGGPETGRSIIAAAMERQDRAIADLMFAKQLNDLIRKGEITREQVEEIIKGNENLAIETVAEPTVKIDKVEVLETGNNPGVAGTATRNDYSKDFKLDVDVAGADPNGVITIKVSFTAIDAKLNKDYEQVTTTNEKNRRWSFVDGHGGKDYKESDYSATKGTIIFRIRQTDIEGKNNFFKVRVGGDYTTGFLQGSISKRVIATTLIHIVIGKRDSIK